VVADVLGMHSLHAPKRPNSHPNMQVPFPEIPEQWHAEASSDFMLAFCGEHIDTRKMNFDSCCELSSKASTSQFLLGVLLTFSGGKKSDGSSEPSQKTAMLA